MIAPLVVLLALPASVGSFIAKGATVSALTVIDIASLVIFGSIWLGVFAHKHIEYSSELWWRFAIQGDTVPRAPVWVSLAGRDLCLFRLSVRQGPPCPGR
jgi:lysylphosphatidylglycerol synthetase-like protein (DUF2156 family)